MSWLVTGGCGFVGSNLSDALLSGGEDVVVFDNLSRLGSEENLAWLRKKHGEGWRFVRGDIRDADEIAALVCEVKPAVIAHLAGQVAMTTSLANPRYDFEVNALGTLNLLEAVRLHSPGSALIYSSTNKVYGDLEWVRYLESETRYLALDFPAGFDETTPLDFHSPYGCSKGAADQYIQDYARLFGLRTLVFRHSSMYGGRQFASYDQGWVGWFCLKAVETQQAAQRGSPPPQFTISGNGKQVRDVLHARDIVRLYQLAAANIDQVSHRVFNIGGGMENSLSILELLSTLEGFIQLPLAPRRIEWRASDQKIFVANLQRVQTEIGWSPQVNQAEGLRAMFSWVSQGE